MTEEDYYCDRCQDTGFYLKTEWTDEDGTDLDYEVIVRCGCLDD